MEYTICKEMLSQRECTVVEEAEDMIIAMKSTGEVIYVFFVNTPKLNIKVVKWCINKMKEDNVEHGIIVYKNSITPHVNKAVRNLPKMKIELFLKDELQYNLTEHRLVPKHEKVDEADAKALSEKYGNSYHVLLKTDPVARFFGFERGDFI